MLGLNRLRSGSLLRLVASIKVNVDAIFKANMGAVLCEFFVRNSIGDVILLDAKTFSATRSPLHAEVNAILFDIETLSEEHIHVQEFESDSLLVISSFCKKFIFFIFIIFGHFAL